MYMSRRGEGARGCYNFNINIFFGHLLKNKNIFTVPTDSSYLQTQNKVFTFLTVDVNCNK